MFQKNQRERWRGARPSRPCSQPSLRRTRRWSKPVAGSRPRRNGPSWNLPAMLSARSATPLRLWEATLLLPLWERCCVPYNGVTPRAHSRFPAGDPMRQPASPRRAPLLSSPLPEFLTSIPPVCSVQNIPTHSLPHSPHTPHTPHTTLPYTL